MPALDPNCAAPDHSNCNCPPPWLEDGRILQGSFDMPAYIQNVDDIVLTASAGAGQAGPRSVVTFVTTVPFLWTHSMAYRLGRFRERINAQWESNYLDINTVLDQLFWGSAQNPTYHAPKFIPANQTISFEVEDLSGFANLVSFALGGFIVPDNRLDEMQQRYGKGKGLMRLSNAQTPLAGTSVATGITIPANGTANFSLPTETAYHFRHDATCSEQTSISWQGYYEYKDARLGYRYANTNKKAYSYLWTGRSAGLNADGSGSAVPYLLPSPELVQNENAITFNLADVSGSTNYLDFCLIGARETVCRNPARGVARCV